MAKWTIGPKIRPCIIKNYHQPGFKGDVPAWFHCWVTSDGETLALVELESGNCRFVKPKRIQFVDTKRVEDEYYISRNDNNFTEEQETNIAKLELELSELRAAQARYESKECEIHGE